MLSAREIVKECFDTTGVDPHYWPDIERFITETVDGMHIPAFRADPFGPSQERQELLEEALNLAHERFDQQDDDDADDDDAEDTLYIVVKFGEEGSVDPIFRTWDKNAAEKLFDRLAKQIAKDDCVTSYELWPIGPALDTYQE